MINLRRITDLKFCYEWILAKIERYKWNHLDSLSDRDFLKLIYKEKVGKDLNLRNPRTYNEKLNWMKLYDHNPVYCKLVDKYEAKFFVKEKIGEQYIIPTIGVWDSFDDIDFSKMPESFVLKCTHDSGSTMVCKNKANFDIDKARSFYDEKLGRSYYTQWREWLYKDIKPRIIAEKYMVDQELGDLADYKIYCFNGRPHIILYASGRGKAPRFTYFDLEWNKLDIDWGYDHHEITPLKPHNLSAMILLAAKLSEGFVHVRVDLYNINGSVYFGEMTFCDGGGLQKISPEEWDYELGELIDLTKIG